MSAVVLAFVERSGCIKCMLLLQHLGFLTKGKKKWFAYLYEFPSKMILTRRVQKARDQTNEAIKGIRVQAGNTFVANSIRDVEVWTKNIFETFNSWISEI